MQRKKGQFIAEAMIALAVISTVVLVLVVTYPGITRALNNTRVRKQATQFAQAEIQRYVNLARVPQRDSSGNLVLDANGNPIPWGYNNLAGPIDDGTAHPTDYPEYLMGSESVSFTKDRYSFFRTVTVTTVNSGAPDEYKTVMVTLSDNATPPRFAPMTLNTQVRKPNPLALDTRQAVDTASLYVQAQSQSAGNPPLYPGSVTLSGGSSICSSGCALGPAGDYNITGLDTITTYAVNFTSTSYWNQSVTGITLSAGMNNLPGNPILLQPVYYATVNVTVQDPSSNPLNNATAAIDSPSGSPPSMSACCNVSNYASYNIMTNGSGLATQQIPIPVQGSTTYGNGSSTGYRLHTISLANYFTNAPNVFFQLDSTNPQNLGPYTLYPYLFASLNVHVQDGSANPLNKSYVQVFDNGNEGGLLLNHDNANGTGDVAFSSVRVNYPSNMTQTVRTVLVQVQRVGFQLQQQTITLTQGTPSNLTVTLSPDTFAISWVPGGPLSCTQGSSCNFRATGQYNGHTGLNNSGASTSLAGTPGALNIRSYTPAGVTSVTKSWTWSLSDPTKGSISPTTSSSSDQTTFTASAVNTGTTVLGATVTYSFHYNGSGSPVYGPNLGTLNYSVYDQQTITVNSGTPPALALSLSGPATVPPSTSQNYTATASYGSNPVPGDINYVWTASGPGSTTNPSCTGASPCIASLTTNSGPLGGIITLNACAAAQSLSSTSPCACTASATCPATCSSGSCATATQNVTIQYPPLSVSVSPATLTMSPFTSSAISATISGGSGSYSMSWRLIQSGTNYGCNAPGGTIPCPSNGSSVDFTSAVTGTVTVQISVTDTVTSNNQTTSSVVTVQVSGSSN